MYYYVVIWNLLHGSDEGLILLKLNRNLSIRNPLIIFNRLVLQKDLDREIERGRQEGIEKIVLKFLNAGMSVEKVSTTGFLKEKFVSFKINLKQ